MATRRSHRLFGTLLASSIVGSVAAPGLAHAHTELDYSVPVDGASVGEPVEEITVAFTSPVSLVGDGFTVLDPQNDELSPPAVTDDDIVFALQFDEPLAGGTVAVRYEVRAEDGHVVRGNVVFDVAAPAPTASPATTTTPDTTTPTTTPDTDSTTRASTTPASTTPSTDQVTSTGSTQTSHTAPVIATTSPEATTGESDAADGGAGPGVVPALAAAAAIAVGGFLLVRSRTST